jgi:hypothetical protein
MKKRVFWRAAGLRTAWNRHQVAQVFPIDDLDGTCGGIGDEDIAIRECHIAVIEVSLRVWRQINVLVQDQFACHRCAPSLVGIAIRVQLDGVAGSSPSVQAPLKEKYLQSLCGKLLCCHLAGRFARRTDHHRRTISRQGKVGKRCRITRLEGLIDLEV